MSYTNNVNGMTVTVICAANPEATYNTYYKVIEEKIIADGYAPKTTMENLITMIVLSFDCDDNYGEYDEETGCGGYGRNLHLKNVSDMLKNQAVIKNLIIIVNKEEN
ncbi:MAG: hypothetical protein II304_07455 [Bacteroidales bacterium]|nr:hypothetical protein [Bacteroidales bacterium]